MTMSRIRDLVSGAMLAPYSGSGDGAPRASRRAPNPFTTAMWAVGSTFALLGLLMWISGGPEDSRYWMGIVLLVVGVLVLVAATVVSAVYWQRDSQKSKESN